VAGVRLCGGRWRAGGIRRGAHSRCWAKMIAALLPRCLFTAALCTPGSCRERHEGRGDAHANIRHISAAWQAPGVRALAWRRTPGAPERDGLCCAAAANGGKRAAAQKTAHAAWPASASQTHIFLAHQNASLARFATGTMAPGIRGLRYKTAQQPAIGSRPPCCLVALAKTQASSIKTQKADIARKSASKGRRHLKRRRAPIEPERKHHRKHQAS